MAGASGLHKRVPAGSRTRTGESCAPGPRPQIVIHAAQDSQDSELGARIRDILLAAGGCTVSVVHEDVPPGNIIIPIVAADQDPLTVLTELRASMPEAYLLPVLHEKHLSKALGRSLPKLTDFLVAPIRGPELLARIRRLLPFDVKAEAERVRQRLHESMALERLRGEDPAFRAVKQQILRVAKTDASVLLTGETGTGKELASQAIHYLSDRANKPFVPVNCGAIPAELFENELFGHHRGAYTDARSHQRGLVTEAEGGTLFLDEINALSLTAQVKLLRFLEDRSYRPLGVPRSIKADVRLLAATNTDLKRKVHEGTFREDLFYRLHVVTLRLSPLRDRVGDIPLLVEYFLDRHATVHGRRRFTAEALEAMCAYEWPGNVRELENVVLHLVIMKPPGLIQATDLPWPSRPAEVHVGSSFRASKARAIIGFERSYLAGVLQTHRGNITRAARAAGQDRRTFRRLVQKHRLDLSIWTAAP